MPTEIKDMTKKELINEYKNIVMMIEECAYGTRDLIWRGQLEEEINRRGLTIVNMVKVY